MIWSFHPASLCYSCYQRFALYKKALDQGKLYLVQKVIFEDGCHTLEICIVCVSIREEMQRRVDQRLSRHRPLVIPIKNLVEHIELIAPPPLIPITEEPPKLAGIPASWSCTMCPLRLEILNSPVELVIWAFVSLLLWGSLQRCN